MAHARPPWLPLAAATRRRLAHVLRAVLCALLVLGLTPGADDLVAAAVHHETAATAPADDCAGDCVDHGCSPLDHHCPCCGAAVALPSRAPAAEPVFADVADAPRLTRSDRAPPRPDLAPGRRPPIA